MKHDWPESYESLHDEQVSWWNVAGQEFAAFSKDPAAEPVTELAAYMCHILDLPPEYEDVMLQVFRSLYSLGAYHHELFTRSLANKTAGRE